MFSELFESVPDALLLVDATGRIVMANSHAAQLFGYPQNAFVDLHVENLMPEGVRGQHRQQRAAYMANPRVRPMGSSDQALVGQRSDGRQFPVEIALSPLSSADGQPRYLASIRDISESLRARQAMVRTRYDALIGQVGQSALESADGNSVIENLPAQLAEVLGIEAVAIAFRRPDGDGVEVRSSFGLDDEWRGFLADSDHADGGFWRMLANGSPKVEQFGAPSSSGAAAYAPSIAGTSAVIPLLDRDRPMGALIALSRQPRRFEHDALHLLQSAANLLAALMQRRRTEEQLAHSQRLDAIGQLTGGVAHDFNNLLTIISGNLQLLEAESRGRSATAELIASALRSTSRGAELTSKLLAFSRRQRLSPHAIDPRATLDEVAGMMRRTLGEAIRLEVECPDGIPAAYADPIQLETALVNLTLNARDAMPRGGEIALGAAHRWVHAADAELEPGHYVVFSVADTGLGMTPETLSRAIEPFFTTKGIGQGSGLGLSMVYGFVKQSGGALHVRSRLGYGTRVELSLPVARSAVVAAATRMPALTRGHGETVLVVEDEPEVREVAAAFLRSLGYLARCVATAGEALQQLEDDPGIALLFTDVMLGNGMNGNELAGAARALRPQLPVLLTSGYDDAAGSGATDSDAGAFELLRKPYRLEELGAAIRRQMEHLP